ncbi:peroxiredoxin [Halanaerobaculum tunisiense]
MSSSKEVSLPIIGDPAPEFTAVTTAGEVSLSDYRGKWLMLFSHPSDFTPVCTTEFISFAQNYDKFKIRNVKLLGLSIDSVYAHIGWIRNIEENFDVEIPFPIIADLGMEVANKYGMIQPGVSDTSTVRAVFIIDPDQIVRSILYYPPQVGRNVDEILRLIDALQTGDKYNVATPANWEPGDKAILSPPKTTKEAEQRAGGENCVDWYFCCKELPNRRG